jgi:hypothetical protein
LIDFHLLNSIRWASATETVLASLKQFSDDFGKIGHTSIWTTLEHAGTENRFGSRQRDENLLPVETATTTLFQ